MQHVNDYTSAQHINIQPRSPGAKTPPWPTRRLQCPGLWEETSWGWKCFLASKSDEECNIWPCNFLPIALCAEGTAILAPSAQASWDCLFLMDSDDFFLIERCSFSVWTVKWHNAMNCCICSLRLHKTF